MCKYMQYQKHNHVIFVYVLVSKDDTELIDRQMLNRRMEDAFFQYALLRVSQWYPEDIEPITVRLHSTTSETLEKITSVYHGAFMTKYAGTQIMHPTYTYVLCGVISHVINAILIAHSCDKPGVRKADGNMKNHRDVCMATNAGYVKFQRSDRSSVNWLSQQTCIQIPVLQPP